MAEQTSRTYEQQQLSPNRPKDAQQQLVQQQFQQLQLDQTGSHSRFVSIEGTPLVKEEINSSNTPVENYPIFIKIDPPDYLAHYMEIYLEEGIDLMVDPLNLLDDYPVVPPSPPSTQNP